jgi:hypothetical protein
MLRIVIVSAAVLATAFGQPAGAQEMLAPERSGTEPGVREVSDGPRAVDDG